MGNSTCTSVNLMAKGKYHLERKEKYENELLLVNKLTRRFISLRLGSDI